MRTRLLQGGRGTNLGLLVLLAIAFVTGAVAFGIGTSWVRWVLVVHGAAGLGIVALAPWKTSIATRGLRRRRRRSVASVALAVLVVTVLVTGIVHSTGVAVALGPVTAMQVHVGSALAALALGSLHVLARGPRPRRTDLSRRAVLRSGVLAGGAVAAYAGIEVASRLIGSGGADRRATGSYEHGSFEPSAMPVTQWLNDAVPRIDAERWTVSLDDGLRERRLGYTELSGHRRRIRAVLDCTGGWWSDQWWEGALLADLFPGAGDASSIVVTSETGYGRRLPAADAGRLLLATRVDGVPLSPGHGFPARLVAPGRRGFWWVKWVRRIELSDGPWWWQSPFPLA